MGREGAGMKVKHLVRLSRQVWGLAIMSLAFVALVAIAAGCGGEEEETPTATGTPAAGGTPTATVVVTATPAGTTTPSGEAPGISDTEILLGAESILSGGLGAVYATIPQATEAYFDYINDTEGGVCGRKIVYRLEDNFDDPAKAVEAARKLVEGDKVFALVCNGGDAPHAASWEYLNQIGVPDMVVAGGHRFGADPQGHPWTVQMVPSYLVEGTFFGQYISENLPGKTVAVLWETSAAGIDGLAGLKQGLDPSKNEIVAEESYNNGDVSISSQVANLANSNAELVVLFSSPGFTAQTIKNADRLGWRPQWLMSYINSDDMMFQFVPAELLEGTITFQALKLAAWQDELAVAKHYELMQEYGGPTPTNFTIFGQTVAEVAVEALKKSCDNLTREGLMEALESIEGFHSDLMLDGVNVSFSDTDHIGLQTGRMLRVSVEDGKGKFEYFGPLFEFEE
jgi:branched-chain amino acid transport system substrate-binding protein